MISSKNTSGEKPASRVRQLVQYIAVFHSFIGVRSVLEYEFRQLENEATKESANTEEEHSEEETDGHHPFQ